MEMLISDSSLSTEVKRHQKLYTMLLDAIPSSLLMVDRDMKIISANHNFLKKSRRTRSNTIGFPLVDVFPAIILTTMNIPQQIQWVFQSGSATEGKRMSYRSPGLPLSIYYYRIFPFTWKGTVENVMLLMDDVTEQIRLSEEVRRVERHLASIIDSATDIIISTDITGRILSWNPAMEKISGYFFSEVRGSSFVGHVSPEDQNDVQEVFAQMANGKNSQQVEWDLVTKEGDAIHVSWVFSPMKDEHSRTTAIVGVGRDLTERLKLEAELLRSQKFAALGVMAGGIAHEIRNPLAICSSAAQFLLKEDISTEFQKECGEKIYAGIQRASIIIENLLRYARPSTNSNMEEVSINYLVKETIPLIQNQAKIQKIIIKINLCQQDVLVYANTSMLQQVLINLFLNAIQSMPDGGMITLSIICSGKEVTLRLVDNGPGISKQNLDKIFDPFYTTSPVGRGTGLGLSISYSIIKQHKGTVEVESREGDGCTFSVRLPRI
jgi:PAS domain S-box-containing protein